MKKDNDTKFIDGFIFGVIVALFLYSIILIFGNYIVHPTTEGLIREKGWGNHYVCYYDNPNTDCVKNRFCSSHIIKSICLKNGGTWELESVERDMLQRLYFSTTLYPLKNENEVKNAK